MKFAFVALLACVALAELPGIVDKVEFTANNEIVAKSERPKKVGDGEIDWVKFMKLYHEHCEGRPVILEYVNKDNVCMIRDRLAEFDRQAQA